MRAISVDLASTSFILLAVFTEIFFTLSTALSLIQQQPTRHNNLSRSRTKLFSSPSTLVSLERTAQREIDNFQEWASSYGVQTDNGFYFQGQMVDGNEDYYACTSTGAAAGSCMLAIPAGMILSSSLIAQEYNGIIDTPVQILNEMDMGHLYDKFLLFVKIILEYQNGDTSPYMPWLQAMPRKWNTAVSMDEFCLSCLPPYIKKVCEQERVQLNAFIQAIDAFEYITPDNKNDKELLKFAYNVVFTRCTPSYEYGDYRIIPMVDMINHGYPDNVDITYDDEGNCQVYLKEDSQPGDALTLNYGNPTNPSQLLATYGFLNEDQSAFFSKILFTNPSKELIDIGYGNPERMIYYTQDGSISQEVWDVFLYSRLEKKSEYENYKIGFYNACVNNDLETKESIHDMFRADTTKALLRHVNFILIEVHDLTVRMHVYDASKHPRLPLLRKHHDMVTETFTKVRDYLVSIQ